MTSVLDSPDPQAALRAFVPAQKFFVGIDSDGCVFNSMEVKHNDCFSVCLVKYFGLAAVSRQVHQVWDFVNLYSQTRGCNRFKALLLVIDFLRSMEAVRKVGATVPDLPFLRAWIKAETKLGNPTLAARIAATTGAERLELERVMAWSKGVNQAVADIVHNLPPFPAARAALEKLRGRCDVLVVSATPDEALRREWAEHGIDGYVALIAGQEMGSKTEHLTIAAGGKYPRDAILMMGDAPGDLKAARDVSALFFPITPGAEQECWERFVEPGGGMDRFLGKTFAGAYEQSLIDDFMKQLPALPPWPQE